MNLTVIWSEAARIDLRRIDKDRAMRILLALTRYAETGEGDVKALQGTFGGRHRLRIGDWRVQFRRLPSGAILVLAVENRGQAY